MSQRQHNEDRMRRAKSWHERSLRAETDDERFIFLWIAFNAAYGDDMNGSGNNGIAFDGKQSRDRGTGRVPQVLAGRSRTGHARQDTHDTPGYTRR